MLGKAVTERDALNRLHTNVLQLRFNYQIDYESGPPECWGLRVYGGGKGEDWFTQNRPSLAEAVDWILGQIAEGSA